MFSRAASTGQGISALKELRVTANKLCLQVGLNPKARLKHSLVLPSLVLLKYREIHAPPLGTTINTNIKVMYYLLALNEICQVFRCVHREDRKRKPSNICHPHSVPPKHDKVKEIASSWGIRGVGGDQKGIA